MIQNYPNHAANERTMLAWVRTALAIIAFGFLVEKFEFFIRIAGYKTNIPITPNAYAGWIGFVLIILGVFIIFLSLLRYFRTACALSAAERYPSLTKMSDFLLLVMVAILILAVLLFLIHISGLNSVT